MFLIICLIFAALGMILALSARLFHVARNPLIEKVDACLPQTQCGQCGFPGCKPYAEAIVEKNAEINLCPPGGESTVLELAELLGLEAKPLISPEKPKRLAWIDEQKCIGCTLCIQACPVDAILGASKYMHTVIASLCTGCELCLAPCPVDCIDMKDKPETPTDWRWPKPNE